MDHDGHSVSPVRPSMIPKWRVLHLVEPALWTATKTEAIDPNSNFWWVDDNPAETERDWLRANGREDRLIEVSVDCDPGALVMARPRLAGSVVPRSRMAILSMLPKEAQVG